MTNTRRWITLAFLTILLLGLAVLAAGLPATEFTSGLSFRLPEAAEDAAVALDAGGAGARGFLLLRGVIIAFLIIYPIYILISLLTKHGRRRLINDLIRLAVILLFLVWLNNRGKNLLNGLQLNAGLALSTPPPPGQEAPLAVFDTAAPGWAPVALLGAGALFLALLVGVIAWWWFMPTRSKDRKPVGPLPKIKDEAQQAVQAIEAGEDVGDVVLRAYYKMERSLREDRGLERPVTMTPTEFAETLAVHGIPKGALNDLTHLFEAVRYGKVQLSPDQQQRAVGALRAITYTDIGQ